MNAVRLKGGGYGVEVIVREGSGARCDFFERDDWDHLAHEYDAYTADLAHGLRGRDPSRENGVSPTA